jgi:hypothetical protein
MSKTHSGLVPILGANFASVSLIFLKTCQQVLSSFLLISYYLKVKLSVNIFLLYLPDPNPYVILRPSK